MTETDPAVIFRILNEIGIIEQLSRALLEARLPPPLIAAHFAVLSHLRKGRDGAVPIDMARAFQVPKTSMTHTLKGLERHGYVILQPNPRDGRSKTVWLTDKGRALEERIMVALAPEITALMEGVEVEKLVSILPVLTDLRVYLDAARDAPQLPSG
jgi:DNA-binding MarR family transcriptional regulator